MNRIKVEVAVVNAVAAGSKALKAIYLGASRDTIEDHIAEARAALEVARMGIEDAAEISPGFEAEGVVPAMAEIPRDEVKEEKIKAVAKSIDDGHTTIDDWNLAAAEREMLEEAMTAIGKDLFGQELEGRAEDEDRRDADRGL